MNAGRIVLCLMLLARPLAAQQDSCAPQVTRRATGSRSLPHALYDQGVESLGAMFPSHRILAARRTALIGQVAYAILVYQETPDDTVRITAVAVHSSDGQAWDIEAACRPTAWPEGLIRTMEVLAALPRIPQPIR